MAPSSLLRSSGAALLVCIPLTSRISRVEGRERTGVERRGLLPEKVGEGLQETAAALAFAGFTGSPEVSLG